MVRSGPGKRMLTTPVGDLLLIAGARGVRRVSFGAGAREESWPAPAGSDDGPHDPELVAQEAAGQVSEYLAGSRRDFTVPVDLGPIAGFRLGVLEAAALIPFGETASYREMAIAASSPGAVRAAGTAMAANPVPILIPCHRVIRSDGTPGLYGGGEAIKRWLLGLEAGSV